MRTFRNKNGVVIRLTRRTTDPSGVLTGSQPAHHSAPFTASIARDLRAAFVQEHSAAAIESAQAEMMRKFGLQKESRA